MTTRFYLVFWKPGNAWTEGSYFEQPIVSHSKYVAMHYKKGTVLMAGPLANGSADVTVLQMESMEQAKKWANRDPAVALDILVPDIKEIRLADWSKMIRSGGYSFLESPQAVSRRG